MALTDTRKSGDTGEKDKVSFADSNSTIRNRRERIHEITKPARFELIQDMLMVPSQFPSIKELEILQPDRSRSTIREHLNQLVDAGIVAEESLEEDRVERSNPRKFFRLTENGRAELEELNLLDVESELQYLYENTDKPDELVQYEDVPRPKIDN